MYYDQPFWYSFVIAASCSVYIPYVLTCFLCRCGHDGIIHGGFAATILDEMLAYVVDIR